MHGGSCCMAGWRACMHAWGQVESVYAITLPKEYVLESASMGEWGSA